MSLRISRLNVIVFLVSLLLGAGHAAGGETNLDFFFKDQSKYKDVVVKTVVSADTFILEEETGGDKGEVVKLIGLKAPEAPRRNEDIERDQYGFVAKKEVDPMTPIEERSFEFVKELVEGERVRIEFDAEKKSEDYSTLVYVFLIKNDMFVNSEILRQGYAHLRIRPPNTKYAKELREAYKEARAEMRGLQGQ